MSKLALGRGLDDLLREEQTGAQSSAPDASTPSEASALAPGVRSLVERSPESSPRSDPTEPDSEPPIHEEPSDVVAPRSPTLRWTLLFADLLLLAFATFLILGRDAGWPEFLLGAAALAVAAICGCYAWLSD
mgnify:CR=1 FL=1